MTRRLTIPAAIAVAACIVCAQEPTPDTVRKLLDTGKYADAESGARRLLAAAENGPGAISRESADALNFLLVALVQQGKLDTGEALEVAHRSPPPMPCASFSTPASTPMPNPEPGVS